MFLWPAARSRWYPRHPAAWDDRCSLPFLGLHRLLVAYAEAEPERGGAEIARLIAKYPSQRLEALKARTILIARDAALETELSRLDQHVAGLPDGDRGFLKQTAQVREAVAAIAHQQRRLYVMRLPVFREQLAGDLATMITTFRNRIAGLHEPLKYEFEKAADSWLQVARQQYEAEKQIVAGEAVPSVFQGGPPIDRGRPLSCRECQFERLHGQIAAPAGCPGLQLYGRRRMGKTRLLRNLDGFLPPEIHVALLEMEDARALESLRSFLA